MSTMVTVIEATAGRAGRGEYLVEDSAIDSAACSRDVEADAQAAIPSLPLQGESFQPIVEPATVRIRMDMKRLTKQTRNEDEELAIMAVINRFYMSAIPGATDRRSIC